MAQGSNQYFPMLPSFPGNQGSETARGTSGQQPYNWQGMSSSYGATPIMSGSPAYYGSSGPGQQMAPTSEGGTLGGSLPMAPASSGYQVPSAGGYSGGGQSQDIWGQYGQQKGAFNKVNSDFFTVNPQYPGLSNDWAQYLMGQIGQGVTPYNLGVNLPTGGQSAPGQLTAGMNPLLQQLMGAFSGGQTNIPGMQTLETMANQGVSALPEWQAMIGAQKQNIAQNQANLKEQFGMMGNLAGTPYGNAMSNYMQQTTADQNSLLGQLQMQGLLQGQMPAAEMLMGGAMGMGQYAQGLDQQAIQNQYNEFIRTQPQYNPMLQYISQLATTYPPVQQNMSGTGGLGQFLSMIPGLGAGASAGMKAAGGGAGILGSIFSGLAAI